MIVTCTSCKTRFRVPAEKVGPKGARVRCSRCKAVFVIAPGEPGGVAEDPSEASRPPDLEPPPLPARARVTLSEPHASAADAFRAVNAVARSDPFAAGPSAPPASPFVAVLSAPSGTLVDPFAPGEPAAKSKVALAAGAGWDPFGVAEPGPAPARDAGASPSSHARAGTDLTELLDDRGPPSPSIDPASLALEEGTDRISAPPPGGAELDLGFGASEPPLSLVGQDPFEAAVVVLGDAAPDPEPPRIDEAPAATAPTTELAPPAAPSAPAADVAPPPPAAAVARRGRLAVALTNTFSLVFLVAVAAALFFGWRGGLVARVRGALGRGAAAPLLTPAGVTGGWYDTAAGAPVLVVRGKVDARATVSGPVRVRVELVDGARVVASATGLAGAAATAEEVFALETAAEAAALRQALDARAVTAIAAGASAPFLVVFPAPAPDPRGLRLRVGAEPSPLPAPGGS